MMELKDSFDYFKKDLDRYPFVMILGKYDQILGPRALYSSMELKGEDFIRYLLRDALNTKNKYVILDFDQFYSQVSKIEIEDKTARGGKQLYAIILLRHMDLPLIPILHFKRIEMLFHKIVEVPLTRRIPAIGSAEVSGTSGRYGVTWHVPVSPASKYDVPGSSCGLLNSSR